MSAAATRKTSANARGQENRLGSFGGGSVVIGEAKHRATNTEHRTPNADSLRRWMFDVQCSMLSLLQGKKVLPPKSYGRDARLFPPEQSSKTVEALRELRRLGNNNLPAWPYFEARTSPNGTKRFAAA